MTQVVAVKFKQDGRIYYFDPDGLDIKTGDHVIVETARGTECGIVGQGNHTVPDNKIVSPLKKVIRIATQKDLEKVQANRKKEQEAFKICEEMIKNHKLDMCLTHVEYSFDATKIIFFFTSDGRVDFRELVKDLAARFHTRIELRQIGVRDEAKMLGGIGICGQPFCCSRYLKDFQPVSIKMAKEQGMSLNPVKISGTCGRLMCCLKYEQDTYEHLLRHTPKVGAIVETVEGRGTVIENNLITGMLKIRLDRRSDAAPITVERHSVKLMKDAQIKLDRKEIEALKGIE